METYRSIVIVPSRTIDKFHEPAAETQAYEQRLLCLLLMLRDPWGLALQLCARPTPLLQRQA